MIIVLVFLALYILVVRVVGTIHGFLPPCVLGQSSIPTSSQSSLCPGLFHYTGLHQLALLFLHPISSLRLLCTDFLAHSLIFCLPTTSFSLVWPIGSGCCRSSFIPISSAYLCASCTRDRRPVHVLLSLQTLVLVPLLDLGLYTNGEILVILYSASNDFIPRPPEFLGR